MSLRNRARRLQQARGMPYQQAVAALRALGDAPAKLRERTGWPLSRCDLHLLERHPIDVLDKPSPIQRVCAELQIVARARAVLLSDTSGRELARAGHLADVALFVARTLPLRVRGRRVPVPEAKLLEALESTGLHVRAVRKHALLAVFYDDPNDAPRVRSLTAYAVEKLEQLLEYEPTPGAPPGGGRSGSGGLPAHAYESVEIFSRKKN